MITHLAHVPIFGRAVFFVGDCDGPTAEDAVYKHKKLRTQISFTHTALGGVRDSGGDVYIWVRDLNRASIVAHELAHAACSLMEVCGIPQCRETEEVMCYLIGWLKINVQDKVYDKFEKVKNMKEKEKEATMNTARRKAAANKKKNLLVKEKPRGKKNGD